MHKCSKCGRAATSLEEIDAGCPCGSKVFTFDKQAAAAVGQAAPEAYGGNGGAASEKGGAMAAGGGGGNVNGSMPGATAAGNGGAFGAAGNDGNGNPAGTPSTFAVPETTKDRAPDADGAQEGKAPESYHARTTFTNDDIENIKVLTQGVFLLDVNAISKNPVVLKDEDEIYYVKLPLVQKKAQAPGSEKEGNGKK